MPSLETALKAFLNREVAVWLGHPDLKVLTGQLLEVHPEHFMLRSGENTYLIAFNALVAVRPAR